MKRVCFFIGVLLFTFKAFAQTAIDPSLTETPMNFPTLSGTISGSLVMPKNVNGKIPIVLIIADAGPTDRDGNNAKTGVTANTYLLLANELGKKGIASVRYDKRLVGESKSSTKESQLHFEDYDDDGVVIVNKLTDDERFSKIVIFGHGEGALVGMIVAYENPVTALILAEGEAEKAETLLFNDMKPKSKFLNDEFKTIMDTLKKGKTYADVDPGLYFIIGPSKQNFVMSWCRYDPIRIIKKTKQPIMIVQGTTDLQITPDNGAKLKKAKSDAILLSVAGMNHVLKDAPADPDKNAATFSNPDLPIKPELITGIVEFINKVK